MDQLLISMPEIAELAGVRRPVVTTWRRRYPDFPDPVAGDLGKPLFDAHQVADWLTHTGRAEPRHVAAEMQLHTLAHPAHRMPARMLVAAATSLVCLRHLDGEPLKLGGATGLVRLHRRARSVDPDDLYLRAEVEALIKEDAWLVEIVGALVEAAWGNQQAFERLLGASPARTT